MQIVGDETSIRSPQMVGVDVVLIQVEDAGGAVKLVTLQSTGTASGALRDQKQLHQQQLGRSNNSLATTSGRRNPIRADFLSVSAPSDLRYAFLVAMAVRKPGKRHHLTMRLRL